MTRWRLTVRAARPVAITLAAALVAATAPRTTHAQAARPADVARYRAVANKLIDGALADTTGFIRLAELVDTHGNRLSGSASLEQAIDWLEAKLKADGFENVHTEPVMVPHWVRGAESAELVEPRRTPLRMLGLGGSVGTPAGGITAPVVVVSSFDELTKRAAEVKGKIVLFDVPFTNYGATVQYRALGPSAAAKAGAVAMLLRSVGPFSIASPHTGGLRYDTTVAKIPAAAITVEDAGMLHRLQARGLPVTVKLVMSAQMLADAPSRNVVADFTGREKPDEIVVVGGHIDSWDVGQGAMDDGGGVVASWEVLRLMKRLGIRPTRPTRSSA
ncbi:MAG: M28 family peptidase [Gemmatimonadetes bacterium]|nr:M28 family peptidase [Gemmatimonadota bacterium]